ncbi:CLUMA_CG004375, isoform A [Clunio marinus]|uniref:CLUMA_CG004375, isoform A n=1 Tax=Clunio marinus TaxID=568069 RepID=A0A1J1HSZ7_9DIPT|nr:CLUMA_CG004375, isoform A [Clunio marinus]
MEGIAIDSLCGEVLLIIFEYLGTNDLKIATLVCKSWNDIIGNHVSTMRNLPLVFDETNKDKEIPELIRKYHTIKLNGLKLDNDNLVENIVSHLTYVKCFEMDSIWLKTRQFIKIFNSLKICSKLTMKGVKLFINENSRTYVYSIGGSCVKTMEQIPLNILPDEFITILSNLGFFVDLSGVIGRII